IVVYGADGKRRLTNRAAYELLGQDGIPENLDRFMTSYCEQNGILARLILGKTEASDVLEIGRRVIRLTARESRTERKRRVATVFILQDITKQELQEQKRKEFVANVSHELKTPLTTIITYSESLVDWGLDEKTIEGVRNDVKRIHDDAMRMQNLVTDLLLLSSIDSKALQMRMESLDLNYLVRQTVEHMQLAAAEKNINLTCTSVSIVQPVFGDRPSIDRIVNNLISNAIKYSDLGSEVKVYIGMVHNEAYVKVTDNGFGIEGKHLSKIFDRFYRVDMTGSRIYGGTGLGLALVKELVDMHNGQITVKSAVGRGTTFTVLLPFAKTIHNKTLEALSHGGALKSLVQMASLNEIIQLVNESGMSIRTADDITTENIDEIRRIINEESVSQEEIMIEGEAEEYVNQTAEAEDSISEDA
ncbi:MAG TPA: cell wall metabolism sensor histidine kinase WalK, partial [Clostridiaceae bacterium]|nr:cell wall metabolism sensor histidine kinase WalK [Clostridiaceae bacterium]